MVNTYQKMVYFALDCLHLFGLCRMEMGVGGGGR